MFEWLFKKKNNNGLRDLIRVLKNDITINIKVSGNINVKERGDSLEKGPREQINTCPDEVEQNTERTRKKEADNSIPNFAKLKKPEVSFGEEKEA